MKLVNTEFDSRLINENLYDKKGNMRKQGRGGLDLEATEHELEMLLGHTYSNERKHQPRKQNMRIRWNRGSHGWIGWWDERPGNCGRDDYNTITDRIRGHLRKWEGKDFDDCFADLKRKFYENKDWQRQASWFGFRKKNKAVLWWTIRNWVLEEFDGLRPDYYVDELNRIHKIIKPKRQRCRDINLLKSGGLYWEVKEKEFVACRSVLENIPSNVFKQTLRLGRADQETIHRISSEIVRSAQIAFHRYEYAPSNAAWHELIWSYMPQELQLAAKKGYMWRAGDVVVNYAFNVVDTREYITLKHGSPEYRKYKAEQVRHRKVDRGPLYDRSLWAQNYMQSHPGFRFHDLLYKDPEEIRRDDLIDHCRLIWRNPAKCARVMHCSKEQLLSAWDQFINQPLNMLPNQDQPIEYIYDILTRMIYDEKRS